MVYAFGHGLHQARVRPQCLCLLHGHTTCGPSSAKVVFSFSQISTSRESVESRRLGGFDSQLATCQLYVTGQVTEGLFVAQLSNSCSSKSPTYWVTRLLSVTSVSHSCPAPECSHLLFRTLGFLVLSPADGTEGPCPGGSFRSAQARQSSITGDMQMEAGGLIGFPRSFLVG